MSVLVACPKCGTPGPRGQECRLCSGDARSPCCSAAVVVHGDGGLSCYGCGHAIRAIRVRKMLEDKLRARFAGTCVSCGCTNERACPGGCAWADVEETVCTGCGV